MDRRRGDRGDNRRYRSRSRERRSPRRDWRDERGHDSRERARERSRDQQRSPGDRRRRSPDDRRRRSPDERLQKPHTNGGADAKPAAKAPPMIVEEVDVDLAAGLTEDEVNMMRAMGMPVDFDTTAGKHVDDESVNVGAVKTETKRSARQYMNRKKGFNKLLPSEQTGQRVRRD